MSTTPTRWEQRFSNYTRAVEKLKQAVEESGTKELSELEVEGMIQRFEYSYELAWKTLQDFLKFKGFSDIAGPNDVLKTAFEAGYIHDAEAWRRLKKSRELTSHTYDEATSSDIAEAIKSEYYLMFDQLYQTLNDERNATQEGHF
jgi:nucleotidyltransferase substrate binding protein (TIGR01987 family)